MKLLFAGLILIVLLSGCGSQRVDFQPWIASGTQTRSGEELKQQPLTASEASDGGHQTLLVAPAIQPTITKAPAVPTPTPNEPVTLPTLRADTIQYEVKYGDTLATIALRNQVSVEQILKNNEIKDPNILNPGQILLIPPASANELATSYKVIPDSELVYGLSSMDFDTFGVISAFGGKLGTFSEKLEDGTTRSGVEIVQKVADENSVNPRLLLALLEYRSGWLRDKSAESFSDAYPMGFPNPNYKGLYKQLSWTANELLRASTLWEQHALAVWTLADGSVMRIDPRINQATASIQYFLGLTLGKDDWKIAVADQGFSATYRDLFGDPFAFTVEPLLPDDLSQPTLDLPLAYGDTWLLTSGPHWGWGTGSPWAALDFAPPGEEDDYGCYFSDAPVLAVADGLVVRSGDGAVVLDLDEDGNEHTGWTILYFHIGTEGRIAEGSRVKTGDVIGYASCEGGVSSGTHFHIARRYNGIWIEADGDVPFNLGGWVALSWGTVYDGELIKGSQVVEAYNGRADFNSISR